mmetsp:Transcript_38962/g.51383  ORF Transcript_38962/g.51383 Transcript_38962/m.51383 type:complete len:242 (+) Transcript_38962:88-813(+)
MKTSGIAAALALFASPSMIIAFQAGAAAPAIARRSNILVSSKSAEVSFNVAPKFQSMIRHMSTTEGTEEEKAEAPTGEFTELSRLEMRVGKITAIEKHPEADKLYVETVDMGEEEPRTIVSGLVDFLSEDELLNRDVIVLANLKPRAMKGITSAGMLLCASSEDHTKVSPLAPPEGTPVGELITFEGHLAQPIDAGNRATKAFGKIADDLYVNDDMIATYKGIPFMTKNGPCTSTLKGSIS